MVYNMFLAISNYCNKFSRVARRRPLKFSNAYYVVSDKEANILYGKKNL